MIADLINADTLSANNLCRSLNLNGKLILWNVVIQNFLQKKRGIFASLFFCPLRADVKLSMSHGGALCCKIAT